MNQGDFYIAFDKYYPLIDKVCAIGKNCENGATPNSEDCTCECPSKYSGKYCRSESYNRYVCILYGPHTYCMIYILCCSCSFSDCILECLNGGVLNNETCTCDCALTDYTGDRCESMCVGDMWVWVCAFEYVCGCVGVRVCGYSIHSCDINCTSSMGVWVYGCILGNFVLCLICVHEVHCSYCTTYQPTTILQDWITN